MCGNSSIPVVCGASETAMSRQDVGQTVGRRLSRRDELYGDTAVMERYGMLDETDVEMKRLLFSDGLYLSCVLS